jgi:hypothetical protein
MRTAGSAADCAPQFQLFAAFNVMVTPDEARPHAQNDGGGGVRFALRVKRGVAPGDVVT